MADYGIFGRWHTGLTHRSSSRASTCSACREQTQKASLQSGCMPALAPLSLCRDCRHARLCGCIGSFDDHVTTAFPAKPGTSPFCAGSCTMEAGAEAYKMITLSPVVAGEAPAAAALPAKRAKPAAPKPAKKARQAEEGSADPGERDGPGEPPEPTEYARNRPRREVSRDRD